MSVHVSSLVYRAKFGSASRKSVALKLADCAHDDGTRVFPSVGTIAAEAEVSERTAQRVLKAFVKEGLLIVVKVGGQGPTATTEYRFDLQKVLALPSTKGDAVSPFVAAKGDAVSAKGVTVSAKGDTGTPEPSLTVKEPSSGGADEQHRRKGELDGSKGIGFFNGKLTVFNGAAAALAADFPGVDISAVCDRAGPDVTRLAYPSADDAMAVLRKWARILSSDPKRPPPVKLSRW